MHSHLFILGNNHCDRHSWYCTLYLHWSVHSHHLHSCLYRSLCCCGIIKSTQPKRCNDNGCEPPSHRHGCVDWCDFSTASPSPLLRGTAKNSWLSHTCSLRMPLILHRHSLIPLKAVLATPLKHRPIRPHRQGQAYPLAYMDSKLPILRRGRLILHTRDLNIPLIIYN